MFVVRTDALTQLEQSASDADDRADKPLLATERTTLLTTIAALAKAAGLNWDKPGQAAARIAAMTQGLGAPVSVRALQDHLSRIPDALERRSRS